MSVSAPKFTATKKSGEVSLSGPRFESDWNEHLVWHVVRNEQLWRRQGTHKTKTRGEVRGGGAKPWRAGRLARIAPGERPAQRPGSSPGRSARIDPTAPCGQPGAGPARRRRARSDRKHGDALGRLRPRRGIYATPPAFHTSRIRRAKPPHRQAQAPRVDRRSSSCRRVHHVRPRSARRS